MSDLSDRVGRIEGELNHLATKSDIAEAKSELLVQSDGREISILLDTVYWLDWLLRATDEQRANWSIEPGGFAIYWQELDDGIELCHLLSLEALS